ncbi:MAG TPA: hypothetical protein VHU84_17515 [Lacipirellulaceae bacterium]|jgi:hypothetical protein|nr:hypothetical protein [Lacipirellulaceae bacterium]
MYGFVHIEKTAGTTLNAILRRSFGARHCDIRLPLAKRRHDRRDCRAYIDAMDLQRVRRLYRNLCGIAGHNVKPYADLHLACPQLRFMTILRDPLCRFRSHFLNRAPGHTREAFDAWISANWTHNWQTKMIAGEPNADKAIDLISSRFGFVGFTERFDESLLMLRNWLQEPRLDVAYRPVNCISAKQRPCDAARKSSDMSYLESAEVRAQIQVANAEDQVVYDFVASTIYPRQISMYGVNLESELRELHERNRAASKLTEPYLGGFVRNYIYKPLLHCHLM